MTNSTDKTITIAGETITIKRVKVKNLTEVTRAFAPFVAEFNRIVTAKKTMPPDDLLKLIGNHADDAVMLATVLTNQTSLFYRELEPIEFFNVIQEIITHSGDFFLQQIFTPLKVIGQQINELGMTAYYSSPASVTNLNK